MHAENDGRVFLVRHHYGDPVHYGSVQSLINSPDFPAFNTAVCLGNVVGADIPSYARDSRVLSTMLILRQLTSDSTHSKWADRSMHIVAENQMDQTQHLAV